jgi:hypothetical protein
VPRELVDLWEDARVEVDVGEMHETREDLERALVCARRLQRVGRDIEVELLARRSAAAVAKDSTRAPSRRRRSSGPSSAREGQARQGRARLAVEPRNGAAPASATAKCEPARKAFCDVVAPPRSGCGSCE